MQEFAKAKAGDRNRTDMTSLEGWGFTIKLRPQQDAANRQGKQKVKFCQETFEKRDYRLEITQNSPAASPHNPNEPGSGVPAE